MKVDCSPQCLIFAVLYILNHTLYGSDEKKSAAAQKKEVYTPGNIWFGRFENHPYPKQYSQSPYVFPCDNVNRSIWYCPYTTDKDEINLKELVKQAAETWSINPAHIKLLPVHHTNQKSMVFAQLRFDKGYLIAPVISLKKGVSYKFLVVDAQDEKKIEEDQNRQQQEEAALDEFLKTEESFSPRASFTQYLKRKQTGVS